MMNMDARAKQTLALSLTGCTCSGSCLHFSELSLMELVRTKWDCACVAPVPCLAYGRDWLMLAIFVFCLYYSTGQLPFFTPCTFFFLLKKCIHVVLGGIWSLEAFLWVPRSWTPWGILRTAAQPHQGIIIPLNITKEWLNIFEVPILYKKPPDTYGLLQRI